MQTKICPCGKTIYIRCPSRYERTRCCSKKCQYKYARRPKGVKCVFKNGCKSWFKKGVAPWNKGTAGRGICKPNKGSIKKGQRISPQTEFTRHGTLGSKNYKWRGDKVGYHALHLWLFRQIGKATKCEFCGSLNNVHWANKSHEYKRTTKDWLQLCRKCHCKYDKSHWGVATRKFNLGKKT